MGKIREWTDKEIDYLKYYYPTKGAKFVADKLNRTVNAVHNRAQLLKVNCRVPVHNTVLKTIEGWTDEEVRILRTYYPSKGAKFVADKLNKNIHTIYSNAGFLKIRRINFNGKIQFGKGTFSEYEIQYMKEHYEKDGMSVIGWVLDREKNIIRRKALQLGLKFSGKEKICKEKGCGNLAYNHGYCKLHYTRRKRAGEFSKGICKEKNCNNPSYIRGYCYEHYKKRYNKGEFASECRIEGCNKWARSDGYCGLHYQFRRKYGISFEEYNEILELQSGVCAICGKDETGKDRLGNPLRLGVDHIHGIWVCRKCGYIYNNDKKPKKCFKCGETADKLVRIIRGLLCNRCNNGIGMLGDDINKIIKNLSDYMVNTSKIERILE